MDDTKQLVKPRAIVYIAGPLTPHGPNNHAIEYLGHVAEMLKVARTLIKKGYAPFCPAIDFAYFLNTEDTPSEREIKDVSLAFLLVSNAVYMLPGWTFSAGCKVEYELARELGIPIVYSMEQLEEIL